MDIFMENMNIFIGHMNYLYGTYKISWKYGNMTYFLGIFKSLWQLWSYTIDGKAVIVIQTFMTMSEYVWQHQTIACDFHSL